MKAQGSRHLWTFWRGRKPWQWAVLMYGHAQPTRFYLGEGPWRYRPIRFRLTPIYFERWGDRLEIGLCLGKRTLYVMRSK
jgi:hypothetical protein